MQLSIEDSIINRYLPEQVSEKRDTPITHVLLHFSSNAQNKPDNPYQIEDTFEVFKEYGVSTHYVIDRAGQIYRFVPEDRIAYHAGKGRLTNYLSYENKLNDYSIGIELLAIGTKEEIVTNVNRRTI